MRNPFVLLALALLISSLSADYVAQFSPHSANLNVADGIYQGHYGNYTLSVGRTATNVYVSVAGQEESLAVLELEIDWLSKNGVLASACEPAKIEKVSGSFAYCTENKSWESCSSVSFCEKIPEYPAAPKVPNAPGVVENIMQTTGEAITGVGKAAASQQAFDNRIQPAGAADRKLSAGQTEEGQMQSQGITTEQIIQLLGALFIAIIVPYLLLQNKAPEITPQDRQLLSNETRAGILQELESADKIPTDLSNKLGKSKATVVEHLDTLATAGFVEKLVTPGKKFVFYRLTRKGKIAILQKAA